MAERYIQVEGAVQQKQRQARGERGDVGGAREAEGGLFGDRKAQGKAERRREPAAQSKAHEAQLCPQVRARCRGCVRLPCIVG